MMLPGSKMKQLQELVGSVTREELIWINGYLSGLVGNGPLPEAETAVAPVSVVPGKWTVMYGTETGNSKKLALQLAAMARQKGVAVKLQDAGMYNITQLTGETRLAVIISTHGDGEPPATAKKFYDALHALNTTLPELRFAVLALGDSAYPLFCKTGEDVDARLEKLGATRILPLQKCDTDFEAPAAAWMEQLLQVQQTAAAAPQPAAVKAAAGKKYYTGQITASINLNDRGSSKTTYHIEIAVPEPVAYEPGDALAVIPNNRAVMVNRIIELTGIEPGLVIETPKYKASVQELLTSRLNICYLPVSAIKKYAVVTGHEIPDTRMDLADLLRIYPVKDALQFIEVVKILTPIAPRLYTISSSPLAHEGAVHITVGRKEFYAQNEQRFGLCSEFLGDLPSGASIHFSIHKNRLFRLPPGKDVIMIGPGTGVAPFRSFLAHRDATGDTGRNWFFFGDENYTTDFLYQAEIQQYVQTGVLTKTGLAFERSFGGAATVADELKRQGGELYDWIQQGASVFISGDKEPMCKNVEAALLEIFAVHGRKPAAAAIEYLEQLKKEGRYEKDVY